MAYSSARLPHLIKTVAYNFQQTTTMRNLIRYGNETVSMSNCGVGLLFRMSQYTNSNCLPRRVNLLVVPPNFKVPGSILDPTTHISTEVSLFSATIFGTVS